MDEFQHEYDLDKAVLITPRKRDFKFLVTPRYVGHYCDHTYEEFTADLLSNMIKDGTSFIDVGAHSGFYSLLIGTRNKNSKIFAFEPVPASFSLLVKNLELNGLKNVDAHNLAVSNRNEIRIFNITEASDSAGFYQHPLTRTIRTIEVNTVALDNFLRDSAGLSIVVKIDTEGHELHVLEGMRNIIQEAQDIRLVVEFNPSCLISAESEPESLLEMINSFGFQIFFVDDQHRQTYRVGEHQIANWRCLLGDKVYANLLCIRKQKSLSVCLFSHSSHLNGAERSLLELAKELIEDYGAVCSVVLPSDGPLRQEIEKVGASTLVVNYSWWCDFGLPTNDQISCRLLNSLKAILQRISDLEKINPDVVFSNTMVIPWGAITASLLGKPHVWFIHEFGKLDHELKFYLSFQTILRFIRDSSNLILTNSDSVRHALFGEVEEKNIATVYYNIEEPSNGLDQEKGLNYFTRPNSTKLIITGYITESKGQEDPILAVKELVRRNRDVELAIMGNSSPWYFGELKRIVKDENLSEHVRFLEFRENPYSFVKQAEIVLLCSKNEAFGRVTVEAMLLKKPVIGTNSGGTPELIKEGFNGLLYEPADYKQLANKIEYFIEHPEKIREFGENGFEFAKATFTKEKYGGLIYRFLADLKSAANVSSSPFFSFVTEHLLNLRTEADFRVAEKEEQVRHSSAERECLRQDIGQLQSEVGALKQLLSKDEQQIAQLTTERDHFAAEIGKLQATVREVSALKQREIGKLQATARSQQQVLTLKDEEISKLNINAGRLTNELEEKDVILNRIYDSHGWKALLAYYELRNKFLPEGTRRRRLAKSLFRFVLNGPVSSAIEHESTIHGIPAYYGGADAETISHLEQQTQLFPDFTIANLRRGNQGDYEILAQRIAAVQQFRIEKLSLTPPKMISIEPKEIAAVARSLTFPAHDQVQVSIIIPVFNQLKFTMECLASVMKYTEGISYEVVVVDDGSLDQTKELLSQIQNLTYLRNENNLGFINSCNLGAAKARGSYVLFLSNAAQVTEKWLERLIKTFVEHDQVGAVGPKILFPDGRLRESGALVGQDCTSKLIGLSDDPDLPKFNYTREVMYCSGACLLVEANLFRELGGFDVSLAPAYCEDWDLAFRLRQQGLRVIYNPQSVVIHHLSGTSDDCDDDFKMAGLIRNQQKLSEKWQPEIDNLNKIKLIALYLPQFHPIPENDRWWGTGFTEWTNVVKARPNYVGHYQPHLPADLGFYDLRVEETMDRQAELAKRYGIYGFCYFYYWFAGKRLLDLPLERMLRTNRPDIPFCLCWANENWTRRWDGFDNEVLIGQEHSDDDDRAVIHDLMRYMRHENYIRINGKPLLIIYRAALFPNIKRTIKIWRDLCYEQRIGQIYLIMAESFEQSINYDHPANYGFDAAMEYPPHGRHPLKDPPGKIVNSDYGGIIYDYREFILNYFQKEPPHYTRFRTVMPSWDNTPRRQNDPIVFENTSPGAYQAFLEAVLHRTHEEHFGDERIVFINAWNEWGEGNHIEPDRRYGYGFLEATRNAQDSRLVKRVKRFV